MMADEIGVGLIGTKFMGRAHSNAYRQVSAFFPDVALRPSLQVICGRDVAATQTAAKHLGWREAETDWRKVVARPDVGLVDVSTPGSSHAEIAIAAAQHGKHVFCEKPLANSVQEARRMVDAVRRAGVVGMVNFNYRRVPAVQLARQLIESGRLGQIYHWRAVYLQDWLMDPAFPMVWRLRKEEAGSGALGDLGAHLVDIARLLVGEITAVSALTTTFIKERPFTAPSSGSFGGEAARAAAMAPMGEVTVDDAALFLARFDNGVLGSFEVSRSAKGRRNHNRFEINGTHGSLVFDMERMNELSVLLDDDLADTQGFRTVLVTEPTHPYMHAWWPAGHLIGYEHTITHTVYDLLNGIATGTTPAPTFEDGLRCQAVLEAVDQSAATHQWVEPASE
jgi:predicted dehydrogenase